MIEVVEMSLGSKMKRLVVGIIISLALTWMLTGRGPDHPRWILWLVEEMENNGGLSLWTYSVFAFFSLLFGAALITNRRSRLILLAVSVFVGISMGIFTNHWLWVLTYLLIMALFVQQLHLHIGRMKTKQTPAQRLVASIESALRQVSGITFSDKSALAGSSAHEYIWVGRQKTQICAEITATILIVRQSEGFRAFLDLKIWSDLPNIRQLVAAKLTRTLSSKYGATLQFHENKRHTCMASLQVLMK
ncbi:hypothetical protein KKB83_01995 [Patescibacteria group bacterium]|nr:hypothetical protein [Patescibacteria group bacterium]